jgi:hypothetical protein
MDNNDISTELSIDEQNSNVNNQKVENSTPDESNSEQIDDFDNNEMDTSTNPTSSYIFFHSQS